MKKTKRKLYQSVWDSIEKIAERETFSSIITMKNKLIELYQARILEIGMKGVLENLVKAVEGDTKYIKRATKEFISISDNIQTRETQVIVTDPIDKYKEYELFYKRVQKNPQDFLGVPTGIKQLDDRMKGLRNSEFGLVTAGTGVGKSIILLDMAAHAWLTSGDVVYVTIEMPEDQIRQRFYCRISGIDYGYFRNYELTEEHFKKLRKKMKFAKNHENKFHIIDVPESSSVDVIKAELENIVKRRKVKVVFLDYLNILRSTSGSVSLSWENQIEVAIEVKQKLARYFQIPVWSANQVSGANRDKETIRISDSAFSKNLSDQTDVNLYVAELEDSEDTGLLKVGFMKTRDFKADSFLVKDNRNKMRFSDVKQEPKKNVIKSRKVKVII
jgi:replicative DNA helicase